MDFVINFQDMNWAVLGPELLVLFTAFSLLLLGLLPALNNNSFLSLASTGGVLLAFLYSYYLWRTADINADPLIFSHALIHDRFSLSFNLIFLAMSLFAILSAFRYPGPDHQNKAEYFALVLMAVAGMMFLARSGNLITAFISLEIFSIALYVLCGFSAKHGTGAEGPGSAVALSWECRSSQESTLKYLLTGAFASAIMVYGMALIFAGTGTLEIRLLGQHLHGVAHSHNTLVYVGMGLLFAGLAFKISAVPFHSWTPDVYQGAPTPITGFMSVATKAAAFAFIVRMFYTAFPELEKIWMPILFGVSALTMLVGNIAAILQDNVKRMLAYSGVAHAGYLLIGILANSKDGVASIIFYLATYLFMNIGAFAVVYIMEGEGEDGNSIQRFRGLSEKRPLLAAAMSLFMISLAGFPPTAGFFGKLFLFHAAIKEGYVLITVLAVIGSMISAYFYLRVIVQMYFHKDELREDIVVHRGMGAIVTVSSAAILIFGLFPSLLMEFALDSLPALPY